jgi:hypothetical protein
MYSRNHGSALLMKRGLSRSRMSATVSTAAHRAVKIISLDDVIIHEMGGTQYPTFSLS